MQIIDAKLVSIKTGLSRTTIWRLERKGIFPRRIQLSPGRVGWDSDSVETWVKSRPTVGAENVATPEN